MPLLPYLLFAIQARAQHKKYGVSPEYMEIALRIQYHRQRDRWTDERYEQELRALAFRFPDDMQQHLAYAERQERGV